MKKILNKRLETISAFIENNDVVLDIGCDHALLDIDLCLNKNIRVIGSDINAGPLEKALENLKKYHLESKIELRLGNGLEVMSSDVNTLVISGMGGLSITSILKDIKKYPNIKKIIISPNNEFILTRKEITKLGFYIRSEKIVLENGKFYLISEYYLGKEKTDFFFGKLDLNDKVVKKYFQYIYDKNLKILSQIMEKDQLKAKELIKENNKIKKVFL